MTLIFDFRRSWPY